MRASLLAGAVLIAAVVGMTWFVMTTTKDKYGEEGTYPVAAEFSDAAGIRWKTRVQIAGIDVGKIENIRHVRSNDGRLTALVRMRILEEYDLYENAQVTKASESLLGDFRIELEPGGPQDWCAEPGDCDGGFECKDKLCIRNCSQDLDCPSPMSCTDGVCAFDKLPKDGTALIRDVQSVSDLDEIQAQLKIVARNIAKISESMANVLGTTEGERSMQSILDDVEASMGSIREATNLLASTIDRNDQRVDSILAGIDEVTKAIAEATASGGDVQKSAENIASLTGRLDEIAASLNDMMESTGEGEASVRDTVEELNRGMKHLAEIARKIDEGEGTVGRLINDDELIETVETAAQDVGELIGGIARLQMEIEWRTQYEVPFEGETRELEAAVKNILRLRIKPKPDKYYLIEVVSDPRGKSTRIIETETVSNCPLGATVAECVDVLRTKTETTTIAFDDLKFSFQFAKRFYFLTMRFGILENTGGVGLDLNFFDDNLELRLDAFDFTRRDPDDQATIFPRVRIAASYEFFDHIGVQGGLDDPFNDRLRTWFLGGLLRFTDEDLKMLLAVAPTP